MDGLATILVIPFNGLFLKVTFVASFLDKTNSLLDSTELLTARFLIFDIVIVDLVLLELDGRTSFPSSCSLSNKNFYIY